MGELIPVMVMETIPGDKVNVANEAMIRLAPMTSPVMHRVDVYTHYFFVPNRLLWPGWEKFITGDPAAPAFPYYALGPADATSVGYPLLDYLGLPSNSAGVVNENVSALPMAAYQMIYNEYYRDQNLQSPIPYELTNGSQNWNNDLRLLRKRAWEHDYFTSCLPNPQKGSSVDMPLGDVNLKPGWAALGDPHFVGDTGIIPPTTGPNPSNVQQGITAGPAPYIAVDGQTVAYDPDGSLGVDPTTISTLRRAFKLQEWLERAARGGTRYIEMIRNFFGVQSSDKRLQRPEYITGSKSPVIISEVLNTSATATQPQGDMAGHGIAVVNGNHGSYYCEEHGFIIGIMSVMPKTGYFQGIPKHFLKVNDRFQYYWEQFAHIGEEAVENRELYAFTANGTDPFGYLPRYTDYRFQSNRVSGDFRTSLDSWHMARKFATQPALNSTFVTCDPTHRIFAVTTPTVHKLWCHVYNKVHASRKIPVFGEPKM